MQRGEVDNGEHQRDLVAAEGHGGADGAGVPDARVGRRPADGVLALEDRAAVTRHVLAVVPGDAKVDLGAVKALLPGTYVSFASPPIAEQLSGSVVGTILPFSFNRDLELIVDPSLLENEEIYFNAARLDRSMALGTCDYLAVARPRLAPIVSR